MSGSLRYRLLLGASVSSTIVLGLLGISVYAAMRHALTRDFEQSLEAEARLVSGMIEGRGPRLRFEFDQRRLPDFLSTETGRYFEVWRDDGTVMARSPSLGAADLPRPASETGRPARIALPGGRQGTAVWLAYSPDHEDHGEESPQPAARLTVVVAADPIEVRHTLRLLGWLLTAACVSAVAIMGMVLMRVVSAGVQPVKSLAGEIESLTEADLGRRFPHGGVPDELLPVVDKLNGLLQRLEGAFAREKSFTADVAHELRTPLTGLRMTLEVCRSQPRKALAYETAIDECRAIIDRMEAMVESLLLLARTDAGHVTPTRQPVDLGQLISQTWALFQDRIEAIDVRSSIDLSDSILVETDPQKLHIVLRNVLDNAVSYVNRGGEIRVATRHEAGSAIIEIANTGSLIAAGDVPRLFERFWRGDGARTDAGAHCGLGLSLCRRLMDLLGGEISVKTSSGGEFVCLLRMKLASLQPQPA